MRFLLFTVLLTGALGAQASSYKLTPDNATLEDCQALGMTGDFVIRKNSKYENPRARDLVFTASGEDMVVYQSRQDPKRFTAAVKCSYGCVGSMEVFVDLGLGQFEYKNDIFFPDSGQRRNDLCRGSVR